VLQPSLPDFVLDKVPMVRLEGEWKGRDPEAARYKKVHHEPRYDHWCGTTMAAAGAAS
jgi:hypothetical protein